MGKLSVAGRPEGVLKMAFLGGNTAEELRVAGYDTGYRLQVSPCYRFPVVISKELFRD